MKSSSSSSSSVRKRRGIAQTCFDLLFAEIVLAYHAPPRGVGVEGMNDDENRDEKRMGEKGNGIVDKDEKKFEVAIDPAAGPAGDATRKQHEVRATAARGVIVSQDRTKYLKIESIGFRVGYSLAERMMLERYASASSSSKSSKSSSRSSSSQLLKSTEDILKFLCKDLWTALFNKYGDKLQTNHRGMYVLKDNNFTWISLLSIHPEDGDVQREALKFLIFPCGIIRGALANLGLNCVVKADVSTPPACTFNVRIQT